MRNLMIRPRLFAGVLAWMAAMALISAPSWAQEDLERPPPIPPEGATDVPIPPKVQDEQIEPTVTIREEEDRMIEEYRLNGQVYMVKVTPSHGKPYYLIDDDGSGDMEMRRNAAGMDNRVPQWTLFSW